MNGKGGYGYDEELGIVVTTLGTAQGLDAPPMTEREQAAERRKLRERLSKKVRLGFRKEPLP